MARHLSVKSLLVAAAVLALVLSAQRDARAQVDTPAAGEARAALREVRQTYGSRAGYATWAHRLAFHDLARELRAGDRGQPSVMLATAAQLRGGAASDFKAPPLQRLANALGQRAAELASLPPDGWPAACFEQAKTHAVVTPEEVQAARQKLLARLLELERRVPTIAHANDKWGRFLSWSATWGLVYSDERDPVLLDRLETRWHGAPSVWDAPEMLEASLAVQSYIRLYRRYLAVESPAEHAAAWTELGNLLETSATADSGNAARIAALVNQRERLGQGSPLTLSIRREFSRPNIILQARTEWVEEQLSQRFDERYDVDDVFSGARTSGSGTMRGAMRCEILPSNSVGEAIFRLDATSRANTRGSSEGVSVSSTATTRVSGAKRFLLDADGLSAGPATVSAATSIVYTSIDAPGLRRRRNEAIRQTHARRPQAEADAQAATRREITARMNAEGDNLIASFNRSYTQLRDRQFATHRRVPEIRVSTGDKTIRWECHLESPLLFAAPGPPPQFEPTADVTLCIAASALEEQCVAALADRRMNDAELSKAIGELLGAPPGKDDRGGDFSATFADHPCDIQFAGGQIRAKLYITAFDSVDVQFPSMTVDAEYNVEQREGGLALVRQGSLRVRPLAERGEATPALSGRQQTLRLAVQRKLNRAFAESYVWASPKLPISDADQPSLRIEHARVDGGWLQIALARQPKPAVRQARTGQ